LGELNTAAEVLCLTQTTTIGRYMVLPKKMMDPPNCDDCKD